MMCDPFVSTAVLGCQGTVAGFQFLVGSVLVRGINFRTIGFSGVKSPTELSFIGICNSERENTGGDGPVKYAEMKGSGTTGSVVPASAEHLALAPGSSVRASGLHVLLT